MYNEFHIMCTRTCYAFYYRGYINISWVIHIIYPLQIRHGHDDVINWQHFPRYWPFVRGIHRSPVNSPHKCQWRGAVMSSLIYAWINSWLTMVRLVIWDAIAPTMTSLLCACLWSNRQWQLLGPDYNRRSYIPLLSKVRTENSSVYMAY